MEEGQVDAQTRFTSPPLPSWFLFVLAPSAAGATGVVATAGTTQAAGCRTWSFRRWHGRIRDGEDVPASRPRLPSGSLRPRPAEHLRHHLGAPLLRVTRGSCARPCNDAGTGAASSRHPYGDAPDPGVGPPPLCHLAQQTRNQRLQRLLPPQVSRTRRPHPRRTPEHPLPVRLRLWHLNRSGR
ncbi:D-Ala-D-Ala carboxypeptidase family metallohydrolase [Streptomyces argenteolus]|uniref:D-Ala-D-Ala carboxypeptidase family metallohydrolase n=1 Tax=Streptomyces sp. NPDC025273 TaxID=3155251 RepID=UPI0033EA6359